MTATYEFKCTPPNEGSKIVRIEARSIEEAMQRAQSLWCRQMHVPVLLCIVSGEQQKALAF